MWCDVIYDMWCVIIWCDVMWCDAIWYDICYDRMCDMIWFDKIWYDMIWYDMLWYDMIYGMIGCGVIWYDTIPYDMIWCDVIWYMIWLYNIIYILFYVFILLIINKWNKTKQNMCTISRNHCNMHYTVHVKVPLNLQPEDDFMKHQNMSLCYLLTVF